MIPNENNVIFLDGFNYDCHFIMKKIAEEFEKPFYCLRGNTENT